MHTLCHNFAGLATARFLLGAIEVCTAPAVIYITGSWLVMAALIKRNCPISLQNKQALTSEYSGIPKLSRSQELQSGTRHHAGPTSSVASSPLQSTMPNLQVARFVCFLWLPHVLHGRPTVLLPSSFTNRSQLAHGRGEDHCSRKSPRKQDWFRGVAIQQVATLRIFHGHSFLHDVPAPGLHWSPKWWSDSFR